MLGQVRNSWGRSHGPGRTCIGLPATIGPSATPAGSASPTRPPDPRPDHLIRRVVRVCVNVTMPNRAAIYCRISDDRAGAGLGVARQEADCRKLAEDRGLTVTQVYVDNDLSAYSGKPRPGYKALLRYGSSVSP